MELPFGLNPYESDPGWWGASLLNHAELLLTLLDTAGARSVIEVGAYAGDLTRLLLLWAEGAHAQVTAIDPSPQPALEHLVSERADLKLVRETSLKALEHVEIADAIILDGDHNYYTVTEELRRITARSLDAGERLPLLLAHDVCWPHARRDDYFDPSQIPAEHRHATHPEGRLYPGVPGIGDGGLPYHWPAAREGGPRNGVLTAAEDFVADRAELTFAVVPAFFGLGAIWSTGAPYAEELARKLGPYDRNPLLERLESNRVLHLASSQAQFTRALETQMKLNATTELMEKMLRSRAFGAAELFLRIRQRGAPIFSKQAIRDVLR